MLNQCRVSHVAPGEGVRTGLQSIGFDDSGWLSGELPCGVHTMLLAAGQIPDPFYGENETACAWMEEQEWWYRLPFTGPSAPLESEERYILTFHGLDTFATVWFDGELLGRHENMFRPAQFDVTELVTPGQNHVVAVQFDPPLARIKGKPISLWGRNRERSQMRKAQFGYGWDWGPRLPTIGVWRPIDLARQRIASITGIHFATVDLLPDHSRAVVALRIEAERFAGEGQLIAKVRLSSPDGSVSIVQELDLGFEREVDQTTYFVIDHPELWWTHDLGQPALYDLGVRLTSNGETVAVDERKVGIRTLVLDQSPDLEERGTRFFRFVLNGVPIFARGANWIPADSFVDSISSQRYESLIQLARDANMTMLRIWGGGIYEHEPFYESCDRFGLLVWQDFMFACAMYPEDDPDFVAEVDAEARYQIRRLRSHPSLALWCGNNENQWIHDRTYWNDPAPPPYGELYYHDILPKAVEELDGRTHYWPGSPFGGNDFTDQRDGNRHNWDVWHGQYPRQFGEAPRREQGVEHVSFRRYAEDMGRFLSEFGMHASPVVETLNRVIPEDQRYFHSPAMDWHNKDDPKNKGDNLMLPVTGLPTTLEEYIDFSMIAQAEGLKFGIEHFRRRKPHCSGTLVWQLNDCWPCLSWSVLDYYENGKAGYYYLKRVFNPVLASFKELADGDVELWITNDRLNPLKEEIEIRLATFAGRLIRNETIVVGVAANSSSLVASWSANELDRDATTYLSVLSSADSFYPNRHFFRQIKDLERNVAIPALHVTQIDDHELQATLISPDDCYSFFVNVHSPHDATRFSDNFFDLEAGERRTITVKNANHVLLPSDLTVSAR